MSFALPTVTADAVPAGAPLLDVREPDEWAAGHAEGALHIPMGQVIERMGDITEHAGDGTLHVVCKVGGRSAQVTAYLVRNGIDAVNVDGGMHAWQASGRPLVAESGGDPFVL
ncbi:rhodanese-like domain-containing protein [Streptomyces marincola]|uniref:Sulfurtransferase n=1 Tax=Streptomyces marincola TaxID=2878388 RepID=A0A1W7CZR2_9ACTN|nr:rhodanese-like domain-containing protein [Streptomyces marincola]ARQ69800.1 sulfurtransferase [Streptomyces marincola]